MEATGRDALQSILEESQARGFLGPGPVGPHIDRALAAAPLLPAEGSILDLGSGGGIPGLPLIVAGVGRRWALLDGSVTRCGFLREALDQLAAGGHIRSPDIEVICGRAEEVGRDPRHRHRWDAVISRSFGPPATTAECAAPLLTPGGVLVVAEPPEGSAPRWPADGLIDLGLVSQGLHRSEDADAGYQVLRADSPCPERYPRRNGIPGKRPLF